MKAPINNRVSIKPLSSTPEEQHDQKERAQAAINKTLIELKTERKEALENGEPALHRLVEVAKRDTGQSLIVRKFMLCLYNGYQHRFTLTHFRCLDKALFDDCIKVLTLDARVTQQEIHCYINNGDKLFSDWSMEVLHDF